MNLFDMLTRILTLLTLLGVVSCSNGGNIILNTTQPSTVITNSVTYTNNVGSVTNTVYATAAPSDPPFQFRLQPTGTNWAEMTTCSNILLLHYNTKTAGVNNMPTSMNFTAADGTAAQLPAANKFVVAYANDATTVSVTRVDWIRKVDYQKNETYDFRMRNELSLQLTNAIPDNAVVKITNPDGTVFANITHPFEVTLSTNRWNRRLHINQLGFHPTQRKVFYDARWAGTNWVDEPAQAETFYVQDLSADPVTNIYSGTTTLQQDLGSNYATPPNKNVYMGDFTALQRAGTYRIFMNRKGVSTDFIIEDNVLDRTMKIAEAGMYIQRCGQGKGPPFSPWSYTNCHVRADNYVMTTNNADFHITNIRSAAAATSGVWNQNTLFTSYPSTMRSEEAWQNIVMKAVLGGWHDAGDFSRYVYNNAMAVAALTMCVDVAHCYDDNLGVPNSGNGIPDWLEEAKWGTDFLIAMQDSDGGIGFLVYPSNKTYENNSPQVSQQQKRYPKTTDSTFAAGTALAYFGSSPAALAFYHDYATNCVQRAVDTFTWGTNMFAKYGRTNSYDVVYNYGLFNGHQDSFYSLCVALFAATHDVNYLVEAKKWVPDHTASSIKYFTWWDGYEFFGVGQYLFATGIQSGRFIFTDMGAETNYWKNCTNQVFQAANRQHTFYTNNAYHITYEAESKRVSTTPYWFTGRMGEPLAVAYWLQMFHSGTKNQNYIDAIVAGIDWDMGANPLNKTRIYGYGLRPPLIGVHQWGRFDGLHQEDNPPGWIIGSLMQSPGGNYQNEDNQMVCPPYTSGGANQTCPVTDRHEDIYNVSSSEATVDVQGKTAFHRTTAAMAARTNSFPTPYLVFSDTPTVGVGITVTAVVLGKQTSDAQFVWWYSGSTGSRQVTRQLPWTPAAGNTNMSCDILLRTGERFCINSNNIAIAP